MARESRKQKAETKHEHITAYTHQRRIPLNSFFHPLPCSPLPSTLANDNVCLLAPSSSSSSLLPPRLCVSIHRLPVLLLLIDTRPLRHRPPRFGDKHRQRGGIPFTSSSQLFTPCPIFFSPSLHLTDPLCQLEQIVMFYEVALYD